MNSKIKNENLKARKLIETDIKLVGDEIINGQIVLLLAYIRDILNNNSNGADIKVSVGKNMHVDEFAFSVNDQEIISVKAKNNLEIG
jgi:hypothetical protein